MPPNPLLSALLAPTHTQPFLTALLVALLVALLTVLTARWHGRLSFDSERGVQDAHTEPTPRVGGLAVMLGLVAGYTVSPPDTQALLGPLVLAGGVAFFIGFLEDVTDRVSVRTRLLVTIATGVLAWTLTGVSIERLDVPGLDSLLGITLLSVGLTAVAVGGVANAVNIVDGFNGLAMGSVGISLGALALLSLNQGDTALATTALVLGAAGLGFGLVNWPWGKLFLGDGGAYLLGFGLAWVAVLLVARHPDISPWACGLICSYPVLEVLFSVWRRLRRQSHPGHPDRLHLHSLVHRRLVRRLIPHASPLAQNSLTGAVMWGATLLPATLALQYPGHSGLLVLSALGCALLYSSFYARLTQFRWCLTAELPRRSAATQHS